MGDRTGEGAGETVRRLVLALVLAGMAGLAAELLLLEHHKEPWQVVPLIVLALGFAAGIALAVRPTRATVRTFQGVMVLVVASGVLGVLLHYRDNVAFEREMDSAVDWLVLAWRSLFGATPALAPGALAHYGLLGLACAFRHPARSTKPNHLQETT